MGEIIWPARFRSQVASLSSFHLYFNCALFLFLIAAQSKTQEWKIMGRGSNNIMPPAESYQRLQTISSSFSSLFWAPSAKNKGGGCVSLIGGIIFMAE